jgi:hypothetical protein
MVFRSFMTDADLEQKIKRRNAHMIVSSVINQLQHYRFAGKYLPERHNILTVLALEKYAIEKNGNERLSFAAYKDKNPESYDAVISSFERALPMGVYLRV